MKQIVLVSSLFVAITVLSVQAARSQWMPVKGNPGQEVSCFARIGANLFASEDVGVQGSEAKNGVFISTDEGMNWSPAGLVNTNVQAFASIGSDLFAASDSGIFLSSDNGTNWKAVGDGLPTNINSLAVIGNYLFAASHGFLGTDGHGVFRSSNKGASWIAVNEGLTDTNIKCLFAHGTLLFAGSDRGGFYVENGGSLFVSTDSGATWSNTWLINTTVYSLASRGGDIFVATGSGVYLTVDTALSWIYPATNFYAASLAIHDSMLFVGTYNSGIRLSTDDGQTWSGMDWNPINTGFSEARFAGYIQSFFIDTNTPSPTLFAGTWAGLWRRPIAEFEPAQAIPAQGKWSKAAAGDSASVYYGASCVVDGKIYVLGGLQYGGMFIQYHNSVDVYDPYTDTWSTPTVTGTFTPRFFLSASQVGGKLYAFGGRYAPIHDTGAYYSLSTLEVFDPAINSWSTPLTSGVCTPRHGFTTAVVNGKIYVIGGANDGDSILVNRVEVFDPAKNEWSTPVTTGLFTSRVYSSSAVVNDKIFVWGGMTQAGWRYAQDSSSLDLVGLQIFDPATNTWTTPQTSGYSTPRYLATACMLGGLIYWIGGEKVGVNYLNTAEVFDPATNTWSTLSADGKLTSRVGLISGTIDGKIYAIGGKTGISAYNTNEAYVPMQSVVRERTAIRNVALYPNPTSGIVTIENLRVGQHHVTITNIIGETIMELYAPNSTSVSFDLSKLHAGTYAVSVSDGDVIASSVIVRE